MIKRFLLSLQFLTILPVSLKKASDEEISSSCIFFPATGALIGLILWSMSSAVSTLHLDPCLAAAITITTLVIITGGLHLDGLADTFDALAAGNDKSARLDVLRDSSIGTMGALALISVIILKILLLSEIASFNKLPALLPMCVLSRWSQIIPLRLFDYARKEGKAKIFFSRLDNGILLTAGLSALLFGIFILWPWGLYLFAGVSMLAFILGKIFNRQFGGLTGDIIGAINENGKTNR